MVIHCVQNSNAILLKISLKEYWKKILKDKYSTALLHGRRPNCCFNMLLQSPLEKKSQSTPAFLTGKFHGQRSLVGYNPWGHEVGHR